MKFALRNPAGLVLRVVQGRTGRGWLVANLDLACAEAVSWHSPDALTAQLWMGTDVAAELLLLPETPSERDELAMFRLTTGLVGCDATCLWVPVATFEPVTPLQLVEHGA